MEETLQALGGLLLKAIPTLLLLVIVHLYLKFMFFRPLRNVLAQRRAASQGLRESAEAVLQKASEQAAAIEAQLRQAREQIYQEQEEGRRRWTSEQAARLEEARRQARDLVHQAKLQLEQEAEAVKDQIAATTESLAEQIARTLLDRTAA